MLRRDRPPRGQRRPQQPPVGLLPTACLEWLPQKARFCRFEPREGGFCSMHVGPMKETPRVETKQQWYEKECNISKTYHSFDDDARVEVNDRELGCPDPLGSSPFDLVLARLSSLIWLDGDEYCGIETRILTLEGEPLTADDSVDAGREQAARHERQGASILGQLTSRDVLSSILEAGTIIVEWGCGTAELSHQLAAAFLRNTPRPADVTQHTQSDSFKLAAFVLIDRASGLRRRDLKIQREAVEWATGNLPSNLTQAPELRSPSPFSVERARIDISDLRFDILLGHTRKRLSKQDKVPLIHVSKHLCGAATDLTLAALTRREPGSESPSGALSIALCCHHRCEWTALPELMRSIFAGTKPLMADGTCVVIAENAQEFTTLARMSSWATNSEAVPRAGQPDRNTSTTCGKLSFQQRLVIGRRCKRAIDLARCSYLRMAGTSFTEIQLVRYSREHWTREPYALVAW
ncbi:tRNA:m4X modification enzyme [Savitreella phatthalungensis]